VSVFDAFLDDAAVFPPGNAPLAEAVQAHVARHGTDVGRLVGPLVLPAALLDRVEVPARVAVVADQPFAAPDHVHVVAVETHDPAAVDVPAGACLVVETTCERPLDAPPGALVKLRTGGADAAAFPTPEQLGSALAALVRAERPFKLTAGLHRAVRGTDPDDGLVHHGFANVLLAVDAVLTGAGEAEAAGVLARQDPAVGTDLASLGDGRIARARRLFTSFGTCSIDQPAADLARLGLLRATAGTEG
jgi:hypothetical protein